MLQDEKGLSADEEREEGQEGGRSDDSVQMVEEGAPTVYASCTSRAVDASGVDGAKRLFPLLVLLPLSTALDNSLGLPSTPRRGSEYLIRSLDARSPFPMASPLLSPSSRAPPPPGEYGDVDGYARSPLLSPVVPKQVADVLAASPAPSCSHHPLPPHLTPLNFTSTG
jgi:hypothetical protein